ncbi:MAG TPA: MHYT domain-containing protein [Magnetospirillaceae bacterium]|jgi:PAS domain S-box-containing protein
MHTFADYFAVPSDPAVIVAGTYDPWMVALSIAIAIFSATMALQITGQAALVPSRSARVVGLLSGSLALGAGIWAMHFIGMLAFKLCVAVHYNHLVTALSLVPGIAASAVALTLIARRNMDMRTLVAGGVAVGLGIGAMHYLGMAAMYSQLSLRYDLGTFALSIVVAVVLAVMALWVRFGLHSFSTRVGRIASVLLSGLILGLAIAGMHYVGMAAARFVGSQPATGGEDMDDYTNLAIAISLIAIAVLSIVLAANVFLRYRRLVADLQANVTQRKSVELALREGEQQLRTMIDNIPGVAFRSLVADNFRTIFVSDAAESLTGYPANDFVRGQNRRRIFELILPEDFPGVDEKVKIAIRDGTAVAHEFRLRHQDGSIRWVWAFARPLRDHDGVMRWLDGVLLDMTDRHRVEDALREAKDRAEQAVEARTAFIAKMSHEIRTPITSILGFTEVLLGSQMSPEQDHHLQTVQAAARSLLLLLNDVLDTAKLERDSMELENADFNLRELAEELVATISATGVTKGIITSLTYAAVLRETFHGDALRIRQILTNILSNAVKFTEHGSVRLTIVPDGESVLFTVRDTGIGIPPDRLERIFEPFAQADASMSRRFGGSGLGTTISRQLVELMGGRIWAESEVGRGSAFHVRLPLAAARERPLATNTAPKELILPKLRILVADDAPMNTELMTILLQRNGHSVASVAGGAEAVSAVLAERFDVVLMDLMMPDVDGLEATRRIRAAELATGRPRTPIIALSASVMETDRVAAHAAGMDGFASKPVELPALRKAIAAAISLAGRGSGAQLATADA